MRAWDHTAPEADRRRRSRHPDRQVFADLRRVLHAAGADLEHVVRWNVYLVQGQSVEPGFAVFEEEWESRPDPPAISGLFVAGLAHHDFLVEMDAVAVVPEDGEV